MKRPPINEIASEIFFPRPDMPYGPEANGAWDHMFEVEDGVLSRLRVFPGDKNAPNILFFHGNGETGRDYDFAADLFRSLPATFMVAEYRGYGPATGTPSVNTFLQDAHRTLDEARAILHREDRNGPIVVMGRSLGSAPAIELASSRTDHVSALVLESGFALTVPLLELIGIPTAQLGITEDQGPCNLEKMGSITFPTLIIHAQQDEIIPVSDAQLLHDACADPQKTLLRVPGAGHNDIQPRAGQSYFDAIGDLLLRVN